MTVAQVIPSRSSRNAQIPMDSRRSRWTGRWSTTPGRLTVSMIVLFLLTLCFGIAGATGAARRTALVGSVRTDSGPLVIAAESLYRSLSDADATAASAFLSAGAEPPALRTRYLNDIHTATVNLTTVSTSRADTEAVQNLAAGLPVYAGLVETARADNRLGLPLGAAYLREASGQMRTVLLPAAKALYDAQARQLNGDRGGAAGFPWLAIPLGLIALVGLVRAQLLMTRRTHRVLSPGLLSATVVVVIAVVWLAASWTASAIHLHSSNANGSSRVEVLADARIDALRARADEALTLVARGNDPSFDSDYTAMMADLSGPQGRLRQALAASTDSTVRADVNTAIAALSRWQAEDKQMRAADAVGRYPDAVAVTIGPGGTDAPALFTAVDNALGHGIDAANQQFQTQSAGAASDLRGLTLEVSVLTLIALAGIVVGFQRRIAEYR